jgi:hypothetical protein
MALLTLADNGIPGAVLLLGLSDNVLTFSDNNSTFCISCSH